MVNKEFEDKMVSTKDVEKELVSADDTAKLNEILTGAKIVKLTGFPTLQFTYPDTGIVMEGDSIVARFKSVQLRKGEYLTKAQLKAIYGRPVEVEVDGVKVVVGQGVWTAKEEADLEAIPDSIKEKTALFENSREQYQKIQTELLSLTSAKKDVSKKNRLEAERDRLYKEAEIIYTELNEFRRKLLLLQIKQLELFSGSLEERAEVEKIKFFAPYCVKKMLSDGTVEPLWKTKEDMEQSPFAGTQIIGLFNLFIRGYDISFFGELAGK